MKRTWAILVLAACGGGGDEGGIVVGVSQELSGALSGFGDNGLDVLQLARAEVLAEGGPAIRFEIVDNGTDEEQSATSVQTLIGRGAVALLGPNFSGGLARGGPIAADAQLPTISCCATAPELTALEDGGFVFRVAPSDTNQAVAMALQLYDGEPQYADVVVVYQDDTYGAGLKDVFAATFAARGGTVSREIPFALDAADFDPLIDELVEAAPAMAVLIAFSGDGARIIEAWDDRGVLTDMEWFGTDGVKDSAFITRPNALEGMRGTAPTHAEGAVFDAFTAGFMDEYGRDISQDVFMANFWDEVFLLALALEQTGGAGGAALRDALTDVSVGGDEQTWQTAGAAFEAVRGGGDVDYRGASGPIDFDDNGEVISDYEVWAIQAGQYVVVDRITAEEIAAAQAEQ